MGFPRPRRRRRRRCRRRLAEILNSRSRESFLSRRRRDRRRIAPPHQIFNRSLQNARPPNESHYVVLDQYLPSREALSGDSCHRKLTQRRPHNSYYFHWKLRAANWSRGNIRIVQARRMRKVFIILFRKKKKKKKNLVSDKARVVLVFLYFRKF